MVSCTADDRYAFFSADAAENTQVSTATENTWTVETSMPQAVSGAKAAVINEKKCVIGNIINYEYDPVTDMWATKKPMPTPRTSFALAACQNKIYVIGGVNYSDPNTGVSTKCQLNEVYDPETDTCETKAEIPYHVANGGSTVLDNKIYVIGGQNEYHEPMNPVLFKFMIRQLTRGSKEPLIHIPRG